MRKRLSFKDVLVYLLLAFLLVAVLTFGFNAIGGLPEVANHFGFALPGDNGLPFRISYLNRDFISPITCAGADWCKNGNPSAFVDGISRPLCQHKQDLQKNGEWPLVQAGSIFTMPPGSPYPIMVSQADYESGTGQGGGCLCYQGQRLLCLLWSFGGLVIAVEKLSLKNNNGLSRRQKTHWQSWSRNKP